jgi:hypothetical protein
MYKRAKDFMSELNSVPMLGKRDPEPYAAMDNSSIDDQQAEEGSAAVWASFPEQGNIMDDVSLVGPPHLLRSRGVLTYKLT